MTSRDKASVLRRESLCQTCYCNECAWHNEFSPVAGWVAIPTVIADKKYPQTSYLVLNCPLYKERGRGWTEITVSELAKMLGADERKTACDLANNIDGIDVLLAKKGYKLFFEPNVLHEQRTDYYIARLDDAESDI